MHISLNNNAHTVSIAMPLSRHTKQHTASITKLFYTLTGLMSKRCYCMFRLLSQSHYQARYRECNIGKISVDRNNSNWQHWALHCSANSCKTSRNTIESYNFHKYIQTLHYTLHNVAVAPLEGTASDCDG